MGFFKKIMDDHQNHKNWIESLDDAVQRNDSDLLVSMLSHLQFEDGYDDILYRLGNFDDQKIIDLLYNYAVNNDNVELRISAIKALLDIAERQNVIYDLLTAILEKELAKPNPSEDFLDIYLYRLLFDRLSAEVDIFLDRFVSILDKNKLAKGNIRNLISVFGEFKKEDQLPFILIKKQNEYFKNAVNSALRKIGYKQIIKLIESEQDSIIKKLAIDELSYIRYNCQYNERVQDWDITEEEALSVLTRALKDSNKSVTNSAIKAIGCYGEFAIDVVPELGPFLQSGEKIQRIIAEKAIRQIISQDKVEANNLIKHYDNSNISMDKKSPFEFNRENMYFYVLLLSILMNIGSIINQFFTINEQAKQIIGFIIFGFLIVMIIFLLGVSIYNWKKMKNERD